MGARVPGKATSHDPKRLVSLLRQCSSRGAASIVPITAGSSEPGVMEMSRPLPTAKWVNPRGFARAETTREFLATGVPVDAVEPGGPRGPRVNRETVRILSGWGATIPERSWNPNRRGGEKPRGRQSSRSTWWWRFMWGLRKRVSRLVQNREYGSRVPNESESS